MKLMQSFLILTIVLIFGACYKNKLPGIEFVVKLDGWYATNTDTIHHYQESVVHILEDKSTNIVLISSGQKRLLDKSQTGQITGIFALDRKLNSENELLFIQRYWVDIDGQYEKKSSRIRIKGTYTGMYKRVEALDGEKVIYDYPYWGAFVIEPKN